MFGGVRIHVLSTLPGGKFAFIQMFDVIFKKIRFRNFMSFGNNWTEVDLSCVGTTLIMGENLDNGGSSGAGKSTLISAISYCLFDKIPSKVKKDKLLNTTNDRKHTTMEVELTFVKGSDTFVIRRFRGETTGIQLLQNGKDITPASATRGEDSFNAKIIELIGFSYELFTIIILFNGNDQLFLDKAVGTQRSIIEELLGITTLTYKANALKKVRDDTDRAIELQKQAIKQQTQQNEQYRKRVADAEVRVTRWETQHDLDIKKAEADITRASSIDFNAEAEVHQVIGEIDSEVVSLEATLNQLKTERTAKSREQSPKVTELALLSSKIKTNDSAHKKLKTEYDHLFESKCPYCLQKYEAAKDKLEGIWSSYLQMSADLMLDEEVKQKLETEVAEFNNQVKLALTDLDAKILEKTQRVDTIKAEVAQLRSALTYPNYRDHVNAAGLINTYQDRLAKLVAEQNPHLDALTELMNEGEAVIDQKALDDLIKLYEHQQFMFKLLTDKNSFIRKNIIAKTMPFLNKRIGHYNDHLLLPHVVLFQPDMTCEISQYGLELDHGNLSNGEKKKLNLALCFAFRDVRTYLHSKINVLFTDEIDGGSISGPDVDALISTCKHKAWDDQISIFIITHRPEFEGRCDRHMVVRKENRFSTLITQPDE